MLVNFSLHTPDINNLKLKNMETYIKKSELIEILEERSQDLFEVSKVYSSELSEWYKTRSAECLLLVEHIRCSF